MNDEYSTKEMWRVQRKLQQMGGVVRSYYIALPIEWVRGMGLEKGALLNIFWHPDRKYVIVAAPDYPPIRTERKKK